MTRVNHRAARLFLCIAAAASSLVVAVSTASADSGFEHSDPTVNCRTYLNAYGSVTGRAIFVDFRQTPSMWIAGSSQWMWASWQPVLYRYDPATGDFTIKQGVGPELIGRTSTQGWDYTVGSPDWNGWFNVSVGYSYRLAIVYKWYWNGAVYHTEFVWAGQHVTDFMMFTPDGHIAAPGVQTYSTGSFCTIPSVQRT